MTEKAIEFLQEWIGEKVHAPQEPAKLEQEAEVLAKECARQAANAGVRLEDIEEEVGDLEELMTAKLEDAVEAQKGAVPSSAASSPAATSSPVVPSPLTPSSARDS